MIILPTNEKSDSLKRKPLEYGARQDRISQSQSIKIILFWRQLVSLFQPTENGEFERKFEKILEELIQNEVSLGGINVILTIVF